MGSCIYLQCMFIYPQIYISIFVYKYAINGTWKSLLLSCIDKSAASYEMPISEKKMFYGFVLTTNMCKYTDHWKVKVMSKFL